MRDLLHAAAQLILGAARPMRVTGTRRRVTDARDLDEVTASSVRVPLSESLYPSRSVRVALPESLCPSGSDRVALTGPAGLSESFP